MKLNLKKYKPGETLAPDENSQNDETQQSCIHVFPSFYPLKKQNENTECVEDIPLQQIEIR